MIVNFRIIFIDRKNEQRNLKFISENSKSECNRSMAFGDKLQIQQGKRINWIRLADKYAIQISVSENQKVFLRQGYEWGKSYIFKCVLKSLKQTEKHLTRLNNKIKIELKVCIFCNPNLCYFFAFRESTMIFKL